MQVFWCFANFGSVLRFRQNSKSKFSLKVMLDLDCNAIINLSGKWISINFNFIKLIC